MGEQIYDNVKVTHSGGWDVVKYAKALMDDERPLMVVLHRFPSKGEGFHWHVAGVKRAGADHQKLAADHPLKQLGKKPVQCKKQLYDRGVFDYLVKPKEYADPQACVVYTNLSAEEIEAAAERSKKYWESKKQDLPKLLEALKPGEREEPAAFHQRAVIKSLEHLEADQKDPGPWLTHKVRMAVFRKGSRFHPYIASLYK